MLHFEKFCIKYTLFQKKCVTLHPINQLLYKIQRIIPIKP